VPEDDERFGVAVMRVWRHPDRDLIRVITAVGIESQGVTAEQPGFVTSSLDQALEHIRTFVLHLDKASDTP
jgi:hypothetical protein